MAAHAMASGHFTRLEAPVFSWNLASMRVLEKVGFVREGILRRSVFKDGQFTDSVMYAQVRNDELPEPLLPTLNTHRLILRPYTLADAPDSQRLAGNRLIAATTTTIPHPYPDGAAEAWIATHAQLIAEKRAMPFAVTLKESGEFIGNASLIDISLIHKRAELAYWIGVDYWSQGYCTEAAQALMTYAHDVLGITRIVARCHAKNVASARVMEKCGLVHEGTLPLHMEKWGVFEDTRLYGMVYAERGEKKDQTDILAND
jgi:RimJ/RimL family protein N-acetyltransferase